jgi:hypothetical protein
MVLVVGQTDAVAVGVDGSVYLDMIKVAQDVVNVSMHGQVYSLPSENVSMPK